MRTQSAFQRGEAWQADEIPQSRIVFIGKGIQREALERSLRSCLAK
ncbi:MAG TPA: GTP-binding protein [Saprospiraceae bacterium]|nr:GTP-binding protein [Saprospiraceae bacterium]HMP14751.1 GTP-binding protein [Saprospiraceae bacterium]